MTILLLIIVTTGIILSIPVINVVRKIDTYCIRETENDFRNYRKNYRNKSITYYN